MNVAAGKPLGFIGLGIMGEPMTRRLLAAGHRVTVWNRSADKARGVLQQGAVWADGPGAVAAHADILFLCVTDAAAVEAVVFGPDGIAAHGREGGIVVDFSSIHPDRARDLAGRLKAARGMGWVDAPVSGGAGGAQAGTLAVMAGGDSADVEAIRPYVMAVAARLTHMGPVGAGQTTKLCNQIIVGAMLAGIVEATRFGLNAGIAAEKLPDALAGGWADSIPLKTFVPRMLAATPQPAMGAVSTLLKDMDTIRDVARGLGSPVPATSMVAELMRMAAAQYGPDSDFLSIFRLSAKGDGTH